jgi:hypothetical protein
MALDIHTVRRDLARLALLSRALLLINLGFIGWLVLEVFIRGHLDQIYLVLSLYGSLSGLLRYFVWKVRSVPTPLLMLAHGTPAERDAAWALIAAHRDELLLATTLPATIHEAPLTELSREALVERVLRHGTVNWARVLRVLLITWLVGLVIVVAVVSQHTPTAEVDARNIRGGVTAPRW